MLRTSDVFLVLILASQSLAQNFFSSNIDEEEIRTWAREEIVRRVEIIIAQLNAAVESSMIESTTAYMIPASSLVDDTQMNNVENTSYYVLSETTTPYMYALVTIEDFPEEINATEIEENEQSISREASTAQYDQATSGWQTSDLNEIYILNSTASNLNTTFDSERNSMSPITTLNVTFRDPNTSEETSLQPDVTVPLAIKSTSSITFGSTTENAKNATDAERHTTVEYATEEIDNNTTFDDITETVSTEYSTNMVTQTELASIESSEAGVSIKDATSADYTTNLDFDSNSVGNANTTSYESTYKATNSATIKSSGTTRVEPGVTVMDTTTAQGDKSTSNIDFTSEGITTQENTTLIQEKTSYLAYDTSFEATTGETEAQKSTYHETKAAANSTTQRAAIGSTRAVGSSVSPVTNKNILQPTSTVYYPTFKSTKEAKSVTTMPTSKTLPDKASTQYDSTALESSSKTTTGLQHTTVGNNATTQTTEHDFTSVATYQQTSNDPTQVFKSTEKTAYPNTTTLTSTLQADEITENVTTQPTANKTDVSVQPLTSTKYVSTVANSPQLSTHKYSSTFKLTPSSSQSIENQTTDKPTDDPQSLAQTTKLDHTLEAVSNKENETDKSVSNIMTTEYTTNSQGTISPLSYEKSAPETFVSSTMGETTRNRRNATQSEVVESTFELKYAENSTANSITPVPTNMWQNTTSEPELHTTKLKDDVPSTALKTSHETTTFAQKSSDKTMQTRLVEHNTTDNVTFQSTTDKDESPSTTKQATKTTGMTYISPTGTHNNNHQELLATTTTGQDVSALYSGSRSGGSVTTSTNLSKPKLTSTSNIVRLENTTFQRKTTANLPTTLTESHAEGVTYSQRNEPTSEITKQVDKTEGALTFPATLSSTEIQTNVYVPTVEQVSEAESVTKMSRLQTTSILPTTTVTQNATEPVPQTTTFGLVKNVATKSQTTSVGSTLSATDLKQLSSTGRIMNASGRTIETATAPSDAKSQSTNALHVEEDATANPLSTTNVVEERSPYTSGLQYSLSIANKNSPSPSAVETSGKTTAIKSTPRTSSFKKVTNPETKLMIPSTAHSTAPDTKTNKPSATQALLNIVLTTSQPTSVEFRSIVKTIPSTTNIKLSQTAKEISIALPKSTLPEFTLEKSSMTQSMQPQYTPDATTSKHVAVLKSTKAESTNYSTGFIPTVSLNNKETSAEITTKTLQSAYNTTSEVTSTNVSTPKSTTLPHVLQTNGTYDNFTENSAGSTFESTTDKNTERMEKYLESGSMSINSTYSSTQVLTSKDTSTTKNVTLSTIPQAKNVEYSSTWELTSHATDTEFISPFESSTKATPKTSTDVKTSEVVGTLYNTKVKPTSAITSTTPNTRINSEDTTRKGSSSTVITTPHITEEYSSNPSTFDRSITTENLMQTISAKEFSAPSQKPETASVEQTATVEPLSLTTYHGYKTTLEPLGPSPTLSSSVAYSSSATFKTLDSKVETTGLTDISTSEVISNIKSSPTYFLKLLYSNLTTSKMTPTTTSFQNFRTTESPSSSTVRSITDATDGNKRTQKASTTEYTTSASEISFEQSTQPSYRTTIKTPMQSTNLHSTYTIPSAFEHTSITSQLASTTEAQVTSHHEHRPNNTEAKNISTFEYSLTSEHSTASEKTLNTIIRKENPSSAFYETSNVNIAATVGLTELAGTTQSMKRTVPPQLKSTTKDSTTDRSKTTKDTSETKSFESTLTARSTSQANDITDSTAFKTTSQPKTFEHNQMFTSAPSTSNAKQLSTTNEKHEATSFLNSTPIQSVSAEVTSGNVTKTSSVSQSAQRGTSVFLPASAPGSENLATDEALLSTVAITEEYTANVTNYPKSIHVSPTIKTGGIEDGTSGKTTAFKSTPRTSSFKKVTTPETKLMIPSTAHSTAPDSKTNKPSATQALLNIVLTTSQPTSVEFRSIVKTNPSTTNIKLSQTAKETSIALSKSTLPEFTLEKSSMTQSMQPQYTPDATTSKHVAVLKSTKAESTNYSTGFIPTVSLNNKETSAEITTKTLQSAYNTTSEVTATNVSTPKSTTLPHVLQTNGTYDNFTENSAGSTFESTTDKNTERMEKYLESGSMSINSTYSSTQVLTSKDTSTTKNVTLSTIPQAKNVEYSSTWELTSYATDTEFISPFESSTKATPKTSTDVKTSEVVGTLYNTKVKPTSAITSTTPNTRINSEDTTRKGSSSTVITTPHITEEYSSNPSTFDRSITTENLMQTISAKEFSAPSQKPETASVEQTATVEPLSLTTYHGYKTTLEPLGPSPTLSSSVAYSSSATFKTLDSKVETTGLTDISTSEVTSSINSSPTYFLKLLYSNLTTSKMTPTTTSFQNFRTTESPSSSTVHSITVATDGKKRTQKASTTEYATSTSEISFEQSTQPSYRTTNKRYSHVVPTLHTIPDEDSTTSTIVQSTTNGRYTTTDDILSQKENLDYTVSSTLVHSEATMQAATSIHSATSLDMTKDYSGDQTLTTALLVPKITEKEASYTSSKSTENTKQFTDNIETKQTSTNLGYIPSTQFEGASSHGETESNSRSSTLVDYDTQKVTVETSAEGDYSTLEKLPKGLTTVEHASSETKPPLSTSIANTTFQTSIGTGRHVETVQTTEGSGDDQHVSVKTAAKMSSDAIHTTEETIDIQSPTTSLENESAIKVQEISLAGQNSSVDVESSASGLDSRNEQEESSTFESVIYTTNEEGSAELEFLSSHAKSTQTLPLQSYTSRDAEHEFFSKKASSATMAKELTNFSTTDFKVNASASTNEFELSEVFDQVTKIAYSANKRNEENTSSGTKTTSEMRSSQSQDVTQMNSTKAIDFEISSISTKSTEDQSRAVTVQENTTTIISNYRESCKQHLTSLENSSGIYILSLNNTQNIEVFCDQTTDGGGWTVVQRRRNGSTDFNQSWSFYRNGFGDLVEEHWLGLEYIYFLTNATNYEMRIDLKDTENQTRYAKYSVFKIDSSLGNYKLMEIGNYSGTAGDSLSNATSMEFTTSDRDNDLFLEGNCGEEEGGGWWFRDCGNANLNANYEFRGGPGIKWTAWKEGTLLESEMKIRPL